MTIPAATTQRARPFLHARTGRFALVLGIGLVAGLLVVAGLVVYLLSPRTVASNLADLKYGDPEARRQAIVALAEADPDRSRAGVTAALEPLIFEGDIHGDLDPDLVLRAYLHWAGPDNVPALIRLARGTSLPHWGPKNTGQVMQTLARFQDPRVADVLAEKLADSALGGQAVDALRLLGPKAESALLPYAFDSNPAVRVPASRLLGEYGTAEAKFEDEALHRLRSSSPDARQSAAVWLADNAPTDERRQGEVAKALTGLLEDLSPKVDALALHALKLWATRDCLPQLIAFARRNEKAGICPPEMIDVLARFPDDAAAEVLALQLRTPAGRDRASQALLKLGPAASRAVARYIDDPDPVVSKEARRLSRQLEMTTSDKLEQILADITDASRRRVRTALQALARLRPDEANRARVSAVLNGPLLDTDPAVVGGALDALRVWGSRENTANLLTLLARGRTRGVRDSRVIEILGSLKDLAVAPTLAEGLTRPEELDAVVKGLVALGPGAEDAVLPYLQSASRGARFAACWVLGEIGTSKSLPPLRAAGDKCYGDDELFRQTLMASEKIAGRK
jgi:hypothetical protein